MYIAFAWYPIIADAWEQLCVHAAYVLLRALGLVTFSCYLVGRVLQNMFLKTHSAVSAFPYIAFIFTALGVCLPITSLYVLCFHLLGNCNFSDIFFSDRSLSCQNNLYTLQCNDTCAWWWTCSWLIRSWKGQQWLSWICQRVYQELALCVKDKSAYLTG